MCIAQVQLPPFGKLHQLSPTTPNLYPQNGTLSPRRKATNHSHYTIRRPPIHHQSTARYAYQLPDEEMSCLLSFSAVLFQSNHLIIYTGHNNNIHGCITTLVVVVGALSLV